MRGAFSTTVFRLCLRLAAAFVGAMLGSAAFAGAARQYVIAIAPGPLHEAIDRLAAAAHLQVLYDPAVVSGQFTQGAVKGSMTLPQAFDRLLTATDVAYEFTAADTVALYRKPLAAAARAPNSAAVQPAPGPPPLPVVAVSAQRSNYSGAPPGASLSATKSEGAILAAPVTFQSIGKRILEDQQAGRVEDVLEGVSDIEVAPDGQDTAGFIIRGIPTYQYYVDGVRISPDLHHDAFRELADVSSIDVIKGPASTLYGRTQAGGLINVVTKPALEDPYLSLEERVGSFSLHRTQLDAGGPLSAGGQLLYRFNAAWETAQSYRDDSGGRRLFLAPVITWNPSPHSTATGYLEYLRSDDVADSGLPVVGNGMPAVPAARRVEEGGAVHTRDLRTGVRGLQTLDDQWALRYHLDGRWLRTPQSLQLALADDGLDPNACSPRACPVDQLSLSIPVSHGQTYFSSVELLGDLSFFGARHAILLGGEFFSVNGYSVTLYDTSAFTTDLFAPGHAQVPADLLLNPDWAYATRTSERWSSAYLQDQVAIGEQVCILLGVRYDHAREWLDIASGVPLADSGKDVRWDHAFKRHAGVVWHVTEPLSFYANYAENFGISTGIYGLGAGGTGTLVPPETAHEWEVGAKAALFGGRAIGSLTGFDLTQLNTSLPQFFGVLNAVGTRIVTGAERSRGIELDLRGTVLPRLDVIASYAFLDTRIVADSGTDVDASGNPVMTPGNTGHRLFGAPRHGASVWATYHPTDRLPGLKLGLGVTARAWRDGDNENDYRVPGFMNWRLLGAYELPWTQGRLALQLNVDNLFNARSFESVGGFHAVMPGVPRRWLLSLRWTSDQPSPQ